MSRQTRRIGNKNEERVCWFLKHIGYEVWMPSWGGRGHGRFRSSDILGVFDVMAYNDEEMILVQVKTDGGFRNAVEEEILACTLPSNVIKEYWIFKPDGTARARRYGMNTVQFSINFEDMDYEEEKTL